MLGFFLLLSSELLAAMSTTSRDLAERSAWIEETLKQFSLARCVLVSLETAANSPLGLGNSLPWMEAQ